MIFVQTAQACWTIALVCFGFVPANFIIVETKRFSRSTRGFLNLIFLKARERFTIINRV
ncbi:hypothetical protein SAMN06295987_104276 [Novosphingobium mathurense]|uniref:Uncharacterized protein n=1 Tax=Novosphingobium mathurense TaxID=428990 RepID=A0A1U6I6M3_9SPHN|nr:hypothetical protein SAMN06295987_104276 [Novosphingobium mathurense]